MPTSIELDLAICHARATIHEPSLERKNNVAILYFHGGGLLYGSRDDLPSPYVDLLLDAGFTLYCFDYPLAPEATLEQIRASIVRLWRWFAQDELKARGIAHYFLFGRSAGTYLALLLAKHLQHESNCSKPAGILAYYGFYDVQRPFFLEPNAYYAALAQVPQATVEAIAQENIVANGTKAQRLALYVYARQRAAWPRLLGLEEGDIERFSLLPKDIAALPPLFITASTDDQDIPFSESKRLSKAAPNAIMKPIYNLEHDFDRDTANPVGIGIYKEAITWMNQVVEGLAEQCCRLAPDSDLAQGGFE